MRTPSFITRICIWWACKRLERNINRIFTEAFKAETDWMFGHEERQRKAAKKLADTLAEKAVKQILASFEKEMIEGKGTDTPKGFLNEQHHKSIE